jgi:hypothetical protein
LKFSNDLAKPAIMIPKQAQPRPETKAIPGTASMPQAGSSPKKIATIIGTHPYTPARSAIHNASAVTSSSVSTGAARTASYVRWNLYLTKVPNIAGNALEKRTAVATIPVPTKLT